MKLNKGVKQYKQKHQRHEADDNQILCWYEILPTILSV